MPINNRRKTARKGFNPDSEQISDAVQQFLSKGGQVQRYQQQDEEFERFITGADYRPVAERHLPS